MRLTLCSIHHTHLHTRAGGHFCRIKPLFRNGVRVRCTALAVLFNQQSTKKGRQVDAQGCKLKLCDFVPLIKAAWRAACSPTVHATVLRSCGYVPFTMKPAYEQLALEKKEAATRDEFGRDGAEDLTGGDPVAAADAQPAQAAVDAAVAELRAVKLLNGHLKTALIDYFSINKTEEAKGLKSKRKLQEITNAVDSTVDDPANTSEDAAGLRAANKAIDDDTTCAAAEKAKLKALAQKIGFKKQRNGGVFTHFNGAASGPGHMLWGLACRAYQAAKTAFTEKKKVRTQEKRSAKDDEERELAQQAFNELRDAKFTEEAVREMKIPKLMALARCKLNKEAEVAKIKKEKGEKKDALVACVWPGVQLWQQAREVARGGER